MPFIKENKFKIFTWGKEYTVDKECFEKVKKIDSYREFIWQYRAPIWLPIIIVASITSGIICYFVYGNFDQIKQISIWMMGVIYLSFSLFFYIKLRRAINCAKRS